MFWGIFWAVFLADFSVAMLVLVILYFVKQRES